MLMTSNRLARPKLLEGDGVGFVAELPHELDAVSRRSSPTA